MNRKPRTIIVATVISLLLSGSLAFAQHEGHGNADAKDKGMQMGMMGGKDAMMGDMMEMKGVPPEKQEAVKKIRADYKDKLFTLKQDIKAKSTELNAVMLQANPDVAKAKTLSKDLNGLKTQETDLKVEMNARIAKETGVRLPVLSMMEVEGGCPMMQGGGMMMGGHGGDKAADKAAGQDEHKQHEQKQ